MESSPMRLRWLQVVNGVLSQKNGRNSDWKSGFPFGEVKERMDVSSFEGERKRGFQRRNTLGSSNSAGRRHIKVLSEGERRGFTSKRCSGEFNFVITGKKLGTRNDSRLEQEGNQKESSGKDTTWKG